MAVHGAQDTETSKCFGMQRPSGASDDRDRDARPFIVNPGPLVNSSGELLRGRVMNNEQTLNIRLAFESISAGLLRGRVKGSGHEQ